MDGVGVIRSSQGDQPDESVTLSSTTTIAHSWDDERKKRTADVTAPASLGGPGFDRLTDMRFSDLQISSAVLNGLTDAGFSRPSPVQLKAIPLGRMGLDLIVQAKSGTGKTVVFVVVLLDAVDPQRSALQALVLSPTREIALQSQTVIQRLSTHLPGLKCQLFVGGLPIADDLRRLHQCHIAVGTPGRVRYLIETGYMSVDQVRHLVLDEADILLAGGAEASVTGGSANNAFPADVNYIWWSLPESKQVMAFSATYSDYLAEAHLQRYTNSPALIRLSSHDPALLGVRQFFCFVEAKDRSPASVFAAKVTRLCQLFGSLEFQQCLIFTNFHNSAQDLCESLRARGWPVSYISSTLDQDQRFRAYNSLRSFHCRVLVSTDLTSRGIDAENVNLVVSLEVPWEPEIYVHRVGRAGRFGSYGASILIVSDLPEERRLLVSLQSKCPTQIVQLPDPVPADLAAPDCAIDLDKLVTVIKRVGDSGCLPDKSTDQHKPPSNGVKLASARHKRVAPNECYAHVDSAKDAPVQESVPRVEKSVNQSTGAHSAQSQLPHKLAQYLDAVKRLEVNDVHDAHPSPSTLNQLEIELLAQLDEYCTNGFPQLKRASVNETQDPVQSQVRRVKPTKELPRKELSKHRREFAPISGERAILKEGDPQPTAPENSTAEQTQFQWSAHQLSAWYEYQKLAQYARWYYASWASAVEEYNKALHKLNHARTLEATGLSSNNGGVRNKDF